MKYQLVFIKIVMFIFLCFLESEAQNKESCVTSKCHANFGKDKFVHGPVAVSECTSCHQLVPNEKHKFISIIKSAELCNKCHEPMKQKSVIHEPVSRGECIKCHDPHQSGQKYQLRGNTVAELCFSCHKRDLIQKKFVHGPAGEGECMVCHAAHTSERAKLLMNTVNNLCFQCHNDMEENFAVAKNIHKPAAESCVNCHNPHSDDSEFMLAKDVPDQCYNCHKEIQDEVQKATHEHKAVKQDKKCLNCHTPHDAPYIKQLKDEPMALCLNCHNDKLTEGNSIKLVNMKDLLEKNKDWHGPIREHDCSGCHMVHGSTNFRILKHTYPEEFYTSFSQEQYELCFSCHQPSIVQDPKTTTLTGFRDNDRNLHYLHVNKKIKGRTCRACHETHASQNPKHIRDSVPFGQWMLPIRYEKSPDGGKCSPGCHAPKEYHRKTDTVKK